jgi:two-component system, OmpR family, response regulator QseB
MRILYVEDQVAFRTHVISMFLSAHQVTVASTLTEARSLLASGSFDAALLDYDLPDGKGIELVGEIQRCGLADRVVAVSSRDENNARLMAAGARAAVNKLRFSQIAAVLEHWEPPSE